MGLFRYYRETETEIKLHFQFPLEFWFKPFHLVGMGGSGRGQTNEASEVTCTIIRIYSLTNNPESVTERQVTVLVSTISSV